MRITFPISRLGCALLSGALLLTPSSAVAQDELPNPSGVAEKASPDGAPFKEKVSYCLGLNFGRGLVADDIEVDFASMAAGLQDALTSAQPKLSDEQVREVMTRFQSQMQQKVENRMAQAADINLAKGEKFLEDNRSKEGIEETPTGLQYRVVEAGDGASPLPSDTVRCHYEGTLINGTVFDSSYKRGQPAEFPVNRVISGWTEALQMMEVGAKWEVFLPAKLAYGAGGAGGDIGPNETLIFTIELLGIVE